MVWRLSILISAAAFVTSLSTSLISAYAAHRQAQIQELNLKRDSIQQLVEQYYNTNVINNANQFGFFKDSPVATSCTQLSEPYKAKCDRSAYFSEGSTSNVYAFDIMLGSKALILANEIDNDISATELLQVAQLQLAANSFNVAIKVLMKAKERATNSLEYVNVVRSLGVAQATAGLTKDANASFSDALGGFKTFGDFVPDDEINYENAQTYLFAAGLLERTGLLRCRKEIPIRP